MLKIGNKDGKRYLYTEAGESITRLRAFGEVAGSLKSNAFVVASGPSVADFPMEKYREYPYIAMNGSILACQKNEIKPYFYICDDEGFARDRAEIALQGVRAASHIGMSLKVLSRLYAVDPSCLNGASVFLLERANRCFGRPRLSDRAFAWSIRKDPELLSRFSLFSQSMNRIGFSKNLDKGYFVGRTIPYVAVQLCHQLGCSRVFLVGVDMDQEKGRFYEKGTAAVPSGLDRSYKKIILPSFRFMRETVIKKNTFEVYNLSLGSRIPDDAVKKLGLRDLERLLRGEQA